MNYRTFIRTWWKKDANGKLVPHLGRKKTVKSGLTQDKARRMCTEYNNNNNSGPLGRKMEFESF